MGRSNDGKNKAPQQEEEPRAKKGVPEEAHMMKEEISDALNQLNNCPTVKHSKLPIHRTLLGVIYSIVKTEKTGIIS
jgi:hypothetical protein